MILSKVSIRDVENANLRKLNHELSRPERFLFVVVVPEDHGCEGCLCAPLSPQ